MAIVKMSEFNLYVLNENVSSVLKQLQRYGTISFKDITSEANDVFKPALTDYDFDKNQYQQDHIQSVLRSMKAFQRKQGRRNKNAIKPEEMNMSFEELEDRASKIDIDNLLNIYDENYDASISNIEGYSQYMPWSHVRFSLKKLEELATRAPFIGTIKAKNHVSFEKELKRRGNIYYMVKETGDNTVFILFIPKKEQEEIEILAEELDFEKRSAKSLKISKDVQAALDKLNLFIEKRKTLENRFDHIGAFQKELQIYYEFLRNEELRHQTISKFLQSTLVTIISGWVETSQVEVFDNMIENETEGVSHLDAQAADIDARDVPIKLRNNKFNRVFEMITNMYSKPSYNELDPTPFLAPFYAIFFGMMLADIGYGILMGVVMFLAPRVLNLNSSSQNFTRFLMILSIPTTIWGVIYGSFFGGLIPINGLFDINKDFNTVLIMSLMFGIFHLFFGLSIKGYMYIRDTKKLYVLYDVIFWYMALSGAGVLISQMFTNVLSAYSNIASIVMIIGMIGIVLTNGRDAKTIPGKFASGLYSLYGITNYVGDVVSYSRLMALGLAGASMGMAFNLIIEMLSQIGILGIIFGAVVFVIGHGFTLFISGLSAYVHSARLTYVEFFGKFYSGGGVPFQSFRAKRTYIETK